MTKRAFCLMSLMLFVAMASGCVRETTNGDEHRFSYELWVPGLLFLGGLIATPAGWYLRETTARLGWGLLILGPIAAFGFAPSMFLDHVEVRPDGFSRHSGIYGMTANAEVKFTDVNHMHLSTVEERGRRGRKVMRTYIMWEMKDGSTVKLPAGNDVVEAAAQTMVDAAGEAGVQMVGIPTQ
jgi:hypothetical protein